MPYRFRAPHARGGRPRLVPTALVLAATGLVPLLVGCGGPPSPKSAEASSPGAQAGLGSERLEVSSRRVDTDAAKSPASEAPPPAPPAPPGFAFPAPRAPADAKDAPAPAPAPAPGTPLATAPDDAETKGQRLVYTAHLALAVHDVEPSLDAVTRLAAQQGGYLALREDASVTIRVPRARFHAILDAVGALGDVLHRDVRAEDVSDEWVDLEARIKNARSLRERLRTLLERAAVKEAIEIEKELARVTEELERLEGKMKLLSDRVAYSTITVSFAPRGGGSAPPSVRMPFGWVSGLGLGPLLNLQETK